MNSVGQNVELKNNHNQNQDDPSILIHNNCTGKYRTLAKYYSRHNKQFHLTRSFLK